MVISLFRPAFAESPADFRVSRDGGRSLRDHLLRGSSRSGTRLVARSRRPVGQSARSNRVVSIDLDGRVATVNPGAVADKRSDLVGPIWALSN